MHSEAFCWGENGIVHVHLEIMQSDLVRCLPRVKGNPKDWLSRMEKSPIESQNASVVE